MTAYTEDNTRNASYYRDNESIENRHNRDQFDLDQEAIQRNFAERHSSQLKNAENAEDVDDGWIQDKNKVIELNRDIRVRRKNFDTYKNAIEVEKTLYNRERHTTILLGCMNAAAIGGCLYVWLM